MPGKCKEGGEVMASEIKCKCGHIVDVETSPIKVSCHDCGSVLFLDVHSPLSAAQARIKALENTLKLQDAALGPILDATQKRVSINAENRIKALEERDGKLRAEVGTFIRALESGRNVNSKGEKDSTVYQQWFGVAYVEYLKRFLASLTTSKPGECEKCNCIYTRGLWGTMDQRCLNEENVNSCNPSCPGFKPKGEPSKPTIVDVYGTNKCRYLGWGGNSENYQICHKGKNPNRCPSCPDYKPKGE